MLSLITYLGPSTLEPALLFAASVALTTASFHFPTKYRRLLFIPTWLLAAGSLATVNGKRSSSGLVGLDSYIAITSLIFMLILPRILFVERHSLITAPSKASTTISESKGVLWPTRQTVYAAYQLWNNPRHLEIRRRPSQARQSTDWSPSLFLQLALRIFKLAVIILTNRILVQRIQQHLFQNSNFLDFTPDQYPIIRPIINHLQGNNEDHDPITGRRLLLRAFMSISWIWANFTLLEQCHAALSIFFILICRFDDPEDWPPLFGNPFDAWTIRRFWGRFWHRITTPTLLRYTQAVLHRVLRPDRGITRFLEMFMVFFLSGLVHAVAAWRVGEGFEHLDIWFFCANFAVIGVELVIGKLWKRVVRGTSLETFLLNNPKAQAVGRALGYVWVFAWFFWAVPRWLYPKTLRCSIKQALIQQ